MVRIQSEIKRGTLRSLYRAAVANGSALSSAIDGFQDTSYNQVRSGQILVNTSGGGYSSGLKIPGLSDQITPESFTALGEEYRNVYDDAVSNLAAQTVPVTNPTDDQIFSFMLDDSRLVGVRQQLGDWTAIRLPVTR